MANTGASAPPSGQFWPDIYASWRRSSLGEITEALLAATIRDAGLTVGAIRGAIFFPPLAPVARLMASIDLHLGRATTFGAAFVAVRLPNRSNASG